MGLRKQKAEETSEEILGKRSRKEELPPFMCHTCKGVKIFK